MKHCLLCLLLLLSFVAKGQADKSKVYTISGQLVTEEKGETVPYATITITNDSTKQIIRHAANEVGKFSIPLKKEGSYKLEFSAVGFGSAKDSLKVTDEKSVINLGKVSLKEGVQLKEVTVAVQKPLIKSDPDKLVYSVEADPEAASSTTQDIIRKVPLLVVDGEDNVLLNGKSNYKVLVNGKTSSLMSNNFKEVIKSMPANTIQDIEVITSPSTKYEAEGVDGIINIITKKEKLNGYNGSVGANVDSYGGYGANAYVTSKVDKVTISANGYYGQYKQPESEGFSRRENLLLDDNHFSNTDSKTKFSGQGTNFSMEFGYEIDTLNLISASARGWLGNNSNTNFTKAENLTRNNEIFSKYENSAFGKNNYGSISGNIDYQRSFKKKDRTFTLSYLFENRPEGSEFESNVKGLVNYKSYRQRSNNDASGQEHTVQTDFFNPITDKHQMEAGVKYILRINRSESDVYLMDSLTQQWALDQSRINDLDYKQHILGAYAGYLFKWKKMTAKAGGRIEQTWNDGVFISKENTNFNNSFFNFIPYVNLSYSIKPTQTGRLSYTQRLSRPSIWYLNPYVNDLDPQNISYGNPKLEAMVGHAFRGNYSLFTPKFNFNADLGATFVNNSIQSYTFVDDQGRNNRTYANIGKSQDYSLHISTSLRPSTKFNVGVNGGLMYQITESTGEFARRNEGLSYNIFANAFKTLWKNASVNFYGGYFSPRVMLQGKSSGFYYMSFRVKQQLLKQKMDISLGIQDPFTAKKYNYTDLNDPTFTSYNESYWWGQRFSLSVVYRFGKMNIQSKKARRGISNDDKMGGGGGEGGGQQGGGN